MEDVYNLSMKRLRIYLDTSVIGGVFDPEFEIYSKKLFSYVETGRFIAVISEITTQELSKAPEQVKEFLKNLSLENIEILNKNNEANELAKQYLSRKIITQKFFEDALHIALATVCNVDVLVSWNFKHIVNLNRIILFNSVNMENGYKPLEIRSPMEVNYE